MFEVVNLKKLKEAQMCNINVVLNEIKSGNHKQFVLNTEKERVECRCGHVAIWWQTGYLCGTITAYPCHFNKIK